MKSIMKWVCIGLLIAYAILVSYWVIQDSKQCAKAGGVLVRGLFGNVCAKEL